MTGVEIVLAAVVALCAALYYWLTGSSDFWARRGVPFLEPTPLIGNTKELLLATETSGRLVQRFYEHAKKQGLKYLGVFFGRKPVLVITDVELVKEVLVRDFQFVMDRGNTIDRKRNPLSANLFNLGGSEWKTLRAKLSPTFTSGKMKAMFYLMRNCADDLERYLVEETAKEDVDLDMAEVMAKFSTDVIGSCAFGIEANSLKDPNAEFRTMGRRVFTPSRFRIFMQAVYNVIPPLRWIWPVSFTDPEVASFFTRTLNENMENREKNKIVRHDFVDLLMELKAKGAENGIDTDILPAQAFIFFLAGFETSSGATSACLMQLAKHADVQARLRAEVERVLDKHDGQITYEALQEMTYMEQVLEETMRLFPALGILPRAVSREYTLPDAKAPLPVGTRILIPIYALHHDADIWPDPYRFDPDRFSEEAKQARPHYAYLPFGEGPRICIGSRFAWMQMKTVLSVILKSFDVTLGERSVYPIKLDPKAFVARSQGGVWLRLTKRQTDNVSN